MLIFHVIILLVFFAGMVLLLRWLTSQQATTATTHLQGLSQDYVKKHGELKTRLEETERQYQEQLAKAQEEAQQVRSNALKEAEAMRQEAVEEAHREAERIIQRAVATQSALKNELVQSFDVKVGERAYDMLATSLPEDVRQMLHHVWVEQLLQDGALTVDAATVPPDVTQVEVRTAYPMKPEHAQRLKDRLKATLNRDVALTATDDPSLVAGILITVGSLVLDGSLLCKVKECVRHAQQRAES